MALARMTGKTSRFGALLDSSLDRVADGCVPLGLLVFYAPYGPVVLIPGTALLVSVWIPISGRGRNHWIWTCRASGCAVATVALSRGRVLAILIAKMRGQLSPQHPLRQPDLQFFK